MYGSCTHLRSGSILYALHHENIYLTYCTASDNKRLDGDSLVPRPIFQTWHGNEARMGNVGMMTQQFKITAYWLP